MYRVTLSRSAAKDISRLPTDARRRVVAAIEGLGSNPGQAGAKQLQGDLNLWRVRVGAYRIVYTIDDEGPEVLVVRTSHRRDAYRGM